MALSHSYVRGLQDAVNDNLDLLPSELRRAPAPVVAAASAMLDDRAADALAPRSRPRMAFSGRA